MAEKCRLFGVALVDELLCYLKSFDDKNCARVVFREQGKSANVQNCEAEEAADDQVADSARVRFAYWPVVSVVKSDVFQFDVASLKIILYSPDFIKTLQDEKNCQKTRTEQVKQLSCQDSPRASIYWSPASTRMLQPLQNVANIWL